MVKYCECGCGKMVISKYGDNKYINGHNSKGKNNPFYGKHHSEKTKLIISIKNSGRKHTKEELLKQSNALKKYHKNLTLEKKLERGLKISLSKMGYHYSEESKRKMSESKRGKLHPHLGRKWTNAQKEALSKKTSGTRIGKDNPAWKGGYIEKPYPKEFNRRLKQKIKKRDGFKCQECGEETILCIHHIDYDKNNNDENNLISLCFSCHSKTNFNREDWTNYFINKKGE